MILSAPTISYSKLFEIRDCRVKDVILSLTRITVCAFLMQRDSKLLYGSLLAGTGLPTFLTGLLSNSRPSVIVGIIFMLGGSPFLISAHLRDREIGPIDWRRSFQVVVPSMELSMAAVALFFIATAVVSISLSEEASRAPSLPSKYHPPVGPEISKTYRPPDKRKKITPKPPEPIQVTPPPTRPNPLDPYDGAPNSKVVADALAEAMRLEKSVKPCLNGWTQAAQQDTDRQDVNHEMVKMYVWRTKTSMQGYADDLRNIHKSLIYRLGVAERNAESDERLKTLLDPNPRASFTCWDFETVGDYFYSLGNKLKAKGD
jgi:hypothetical protein